MTLPSPRFIPDAVLERRALDLLREHERRTGSPISLPVPIDAIVERTLGLRVVWLPIEEQPGEIILARIDPDYRGHPTIQMNENRVAHFEGFFGTEQFSLAHEAGHWVLHYGRGRGRQLGLLPDTAEQADAVVLCRRMSDGDRRELQADRFAAYLLLPEHLVRPAVARFDLIRRGDVTRLARDCGVSKRAMARRLDSLGMVHLGVNGELLPCERSGQSGLL
ncbi:MAG: ImmA/IrrE family metallo-endopeptidase [Chloroflexota bacterium]|nr:ImmA/IrrE family metallo-endopeptidase [Chloroflexota bacterium]